MSTAAAGKDLTLANRGTNRVFIGPGAKSKGGSTKMLKFDTAADTAVPADKRLGQVHTITGADAERIRSSKVFEAVKDRVGLRVG